MRYILYYHNFYGMLILRYSDDSNGDRFSERYMGYSVTEAIRRFREKHGLKGKRIDVASLDDIK